MWSDQVKKSVKYHHVLIFIWNILFSGKGDKSGVKGQSEETRGFLTSSGGVGSAAKIVYG